MRFLVLALLSVAGCTAPPSLLIGTWMGDVTKHNVSCTDGSHGSDNVAAVEVPLSEVNGQILEHAKCADLLFDENGPSSASLSRAATCEPQMVNGQLVTETIESYSLAVAGNRLTVDSLSDIQIGAAGSCIFETTGSLTRK